MAEQQSWIEAADQNVAKLYGDYLYEIPNYQRPFSWEDEQFDQLIDDLLDAYDRNREEYGSVDEILEYDPYFLGSLVLQKVEDNKKIYDIVDGQQRITSLAILMAVLRDELAPTDDWEKIRDEELSLGGMPGNLQERLYTDGDDFAGMSKSYRLKVRQDERNFFNNYILEEGGTELIESVDKNHRSESEQRYMEAVDIFRSRLEDWRSEDDQELEEFAEYLGQRIMMVEISTGSRDSAFRLFNVVNSRGKPLSPADLLKSENLGQIPEDDEQKYSKKWDNVRKDVGTEVFDTLIGIIRHLKVKQKARKSVYDEFVDEVFEEEPDFKGKQFVEYLESIREIYEQRLEKKEVSPSDRKKRVRYETLVSIIKHYYPSEDWMMGVIKFDREFSDEDGFVEFFEKYERKLAADWISGLGRTARLTQMYRVVELLESADSVDEVLNDDLLNSDIESHHEDFMNTLDADNFYRKGNYRMAKYVLLRLDMERRDNADVSTYHESISVEHILPQTAEEEYWLERFDEPFRVKWTHRLGNLVPLNGRKNSSASNYDFPRKVSEYIDEKSDFALVDDLTEKDDWTPEELEARHEKLKEEASECWFS
jgi:uncharacterized protein with ParB-like and HNH nuclease domain